jgi:methylthioribose-1-phosphate isomerase
MSADREPLFTLRLAADGWAVEVLDQTGLPHAVTVVRLETAVQAAQAIAAMVVRGAPLIGATAAYGLCLALRADPGDRSLAAARALLLAARPTAVNLRWALDAVETEVRPLPPGERAAAAYRRAAALCEEDVQICAAIGEHGRAIIEERWRAASRARPVQILTHCNAGWLASLRWGTALAPVYKAHAAGVPLHVWVDETRPRNQGAALTAWELGRAGVPHTVVVDNAGGHLMQRGLVDLCLVGSDRTTARGDVCNKIGTYLKALAARAHAVPFYVGLPGPTIDWTAEDGLAQIPIEERSGEEVRRVTGLAADGRLTTVDLLPASSAVANPAFDITPAALVTALITERGVCAASRAGLLDLYPEHR